DAPERHTERLARAIGCPFTHQLRVDGRVAVFEPVTQLLRRSAADVARQIGFCTQHAAERDKFVRAEAVVILDLQAARHAQPRRTLTDAVAPRVVISVAAAGPA